MGLRTRTGLVAAPAALVALDPGAADEEGFADDGALTRAAGDGAGRRLAGGALGQHLADDVRRDLEGRADGDGGGGTADGRGEGGTAGFEGEGRAGDGQAMVAEEHPALAAVVISGVVRFGALGTGKQLRRRVDHGPRLYAPGEGRFDLGGEVEGLSRGHGQAALVESAQGLGQEGAFAGDAAGTNLVVEGEGLDVGAGGVGGTWAAGSAGMGKRQ